MHGSAWLNTLCVSTPVSTPLASENWNASSVLSRGMFMKVSNEWRQGGCAAEHGESFLAVREPDLSRGPFVSRRMAQPLLDRDIEAGGFPLPPRSRCNHRNKAALL